MHLNLTRGRALLFFAISLLYFIPSTAQTGIEGDVQMILKADTEPIIDGEMDDAVWINASEHLITHIDESGSIGPDDWYDSFGSWRMLWDDVNIYLFCCIKDDIIQDEHVNFWEQDGIVVYFDCDNSKAGQFDGVDDSNYFINHWHTTDQDIIAIGSCVSQGIDFMVKDLENGIGWQMEAAIPVENINLAAESGLEFGFDMEVNDNDGANREHVIKWWSNDTKTWCNPSVWGTCALSAVSTTGNMPVIFLEDIIVDGDYDDAWKNAPIYTSNMDEYDETYPDAWTDAWFQFQTAWDGEKLYCYTRIFDDAISDVHTNAWERDGLEYYFDGDNSKDLHLYDGVNDLNFLINHGDMTSLDIECGFEWLDTGSIDFSVSEDEFGYNIEMSIPLAELQIDNTAGTEYGFEIKQNDNDSDHREGIRSWYGSGWWSEFDASSFGTAVLVGGDDQISNPSITLLAPNGFEIWLAEGIQTIRWSAHDVDQVKLEYSTNSGGSWTTIVTNFQASGGQYSWTVPDVNSLNCLVRITDVSNAGVSDQSSTVFFILKSGLALISPNGGESWGLGITETIRWSSVGVDRVKLEYSTNGENWVIIQSSVAAASGQYTWTVPGINSSGCLVRISSTMNTGITDMSDGVFTITHKGITVQYPINGKELKSGNLVDIQWQSSGIEKVNLYISYTNGASWDTLASDVNSTGIYSWSVPWIITMQGKIKIEDAANPSLYTISGGVFTIKSGFVTGLTGSSETPEIFMLFQNYPNPFNSCTRISYRLPGSAHVGLSIYNMEGQCVYAMEETSEAGYHSFQWDGRDQNGRGMSSGVYVYRVDAESGSRSFSETRKMFLVK